MSFDDPYIILGVPRTASLAQIKAAYRRQAQANHPDRHQDKDAIERNAYEQQFKRATWAYDVLSDAEARAYYDQHGCTRAEAATRPVTDVDRTLIETFRLTLTNTRPSDVPHTDMVHQMRVKLTDDLEAARADIQRLKLGRKELLNLDGRIFCRGQPENVIVRAIREDIAHHEAVIEDRTRTEQHLRACITELQFWRFRRNGDEDDAPVVSQPSRRLRR